MAVDSAFILHIAMFVRRLLRLLGVVVLVAVLNAIPAVTAEGWKLDPDCGNDLYGVAGFLLSADELDIACHLVLNTVQPQLSSESGTMVESVHELSEEPDIPNTQLVLEEILDNVNEEWKQIRVDVSKFVGVVPALSSCGNDRKWVALTFDDGPDAIYADGIVEELNTLGVPATFFFSPLARGYNQDTLCEKAQMLAESGHELQLHTMTHPHLPTLQQWDFDWEVQGGIEWMKKCDLPEPNMFRPPFGELRPGQAAYLFDRYKLIVAQWNVESSDFDDTLTQEDIFENIRREFESNVGFGNSAVILMHDFHAGKRAGIITRVVKYFRDRGYSFVTMNRCYSACNGPICKGNGGPSPYKDVYVP